jgi:hypothetical protein
MVLGIVLEISVPGTVVTTPGTVVTPPLGMVGPVGAGTSEVTETLDELDELDELVEPSVVGVVEVPEANVLVGASDEELVAATVVVVCALTVCATPPRIDPANSTLNTLRRPAEMREVPLFVALELLWGVRL